MIIVTDTLVVIAVVLNEATKPELIRLATGAELIAALSPHWKVGNALSAMLKRSCLTFAEAQQALIK